jgi:hypothetical protein
MKIRDLYRRWMAMTFISRELGVEDPELQTSTQQLFDAGAMGTLKPMSTLAGPVSDETVLPEDRDE